MYSNNKKNANDDESHSDLSSSSEAVEIVIKRKSLLICSFKIEYVLLIITTFSIFIEHDDDNDNSTLNKKKRHTLFQSKWTTQYPWTEQDICNPSYARCKLCFTRFSVASGGDYHIKRHKSSSKHQNISKGSFNKDQKVSEFFKDSEITKYAIVSEATFVYHTVRHAHSFISAECTIDLLKALFKDSKIIKNMTCGKTKIAKISQQVLKQAAREYILEDLHNNHPFSIATDASNKGNVKTFPLILSYFVKEKGICRKLLCFFKSDSEKSKDISSILVDKIVSAKLCINDVTAFCADNASVNFGKNQSVFVELKNLNQKIIPVGCICHVLHNAAKKGAKNLRYDIECIIIKCFNEFSSSTKNVSTLQEFITFAEQEWAELLRHCPTRWLSLVPATERILKQFEPLKSYFLSHNLPPKYLEKFFNDPLAEAYLSFILYIGTLLNKTIALFEADTVLVTSFTSIVEDTLNVLKESVEQKFFGNLTMTVLRKSDELDEVKRFENQCVIYIETVIKYIEINCKTKETFKEFAFMELKTIPGFDSFSDLNNKYQILREHNLDEFFTEYTKFKKYIMSISESLTTLSTVEKWQKILINNNFPNIEKIASFIFSIPHSNASSERIFSCSSFLWRKERNKLDINSVEAELMIKTNFNFSCKEFKDFLLNSNIGKKVLTEVRKNEKYVNSKNNDENDY